MNNKATDNVQSIGRSNIKNFGVKAPWGVVPLAGGPYRDKPDDSNYFGIKVAREIDRPYSVKIDIEDFCIPTRPGEVELAIVSALVAARMGSVPYVGCMGGMGRTGTILGIMVKALTRASRSRILGVQFGKVPDPVDYVREHYNPHACETGQQQKYVRGFDTGWIEEVLLTL